MHEPGTIARSRWGYSVAKTNEHDGVLGHAVAGGVFGSAVERGRLIEVAPPEAQGVEGETRLELATLTSSWRASRLSL